MSQRIIRRIVCLINRIFIYSTVDTRREFTIVTTSLLRFCNIIMRGSILRTCATY